MVEFIQSVENSHDYVGSARPGNPAEVRVAGGEHGEDVAGMLAFNSVSGRQSKIRTHVEAADESGDGQQQWRSSSKRLEERRAKLGACFQIGDRRPCILAGTCSWSRNGMDGIWEAWATQDSSRTPCSSRNPRGRIFVKGRDGRGERFGISWFGGKPFEKTTSKSRSTRSQEEEVEERKRRAFKTPSRKRRRCQRKRKERVRRTTMLQLEQQQWLLRWFGAWFGMQRQSEKGSQMHEVSITRAPVFPVPEEGVNHFNVVGVLVMAGKSDQRQSVELGGASSSSRPAASGGEDHGDDQGREGGERENKPFDEKAMDMKDFMSVEEYTKNRKFLFVHHFAGLNDVLGKALLAAADVHGLKVEVISVDKEAKTGDLMSAEPYESHLQLAKEGKVDGYHSGWPCTTFSRLRWRHQVGMPQPVRSRTFPYGIPSNTGKQQEECDAGTIMLARSLNMAEEIEKSRGTKTIGGFYTLENPPWSELADHQSAWEMEETKAFIDKWHPMQVDFNTCFYEEDVALGQRHFKPQHFAGSLHGLRELEGGCRCGNARHDPIVGSVKSKASAEYPKALCAKYAELTMKHFKKLAQMEHLQLKVRFMEEHLAKMKRKAQQVGAEPVLSRAPWSPDKRPRLEERPTSTLASEWHGHHEVHEWRGGFGKHEALRASQAKKQDPKQQVYLGGMRHPARTIRTMAAAQSWGWKIQGAWNNFCEAHPKVMEVAEKYGSPECEIDENLVKEWNERLRDILKAKEPKVLLTDNKRYRSKLDGELLAAWIDRVQDPDVSIPKWIEEGVPLGIECPIETHGVFPPSDEVGPSLASEDATTAIIRGDLVNYVSVEDNKQHAVDELRRYEECRYLFRMKAEEAEVQFKKRTISKLGLILKEKEDGSLKKRIIIDMRRSKGNQKAHLPERLVLPRPLDAVEMIRDVFNTDDGRNYHPEKRWGSEFVLIDVTDAFMSFAVKEEEWGHCLSPAPQEGDEEADLVWYCTVVRF